MIVIASQQFIGPGDEGYRSTEELRQEAAQFVRQTQQDYMDTLRRDDQGAGGRGGEGQGEGGTPRLQFGGQSFNLRMPDDTDRAVARELPPPEADAVLRDPETGRYYGSDGNRWYPLEVN